MNTSTALQTELSGINDECLATVLVATSAKFLNALADQQSIQLFGKVAQMKLSQLRANDADFCAKAERAGLVIPAKEIPISDIYEWAERAGLVIATKEIPIGDTYEEEEKSADAVLVDIAVSLFDADALEAWSTLQNTEAGQGTTSSDLPHTKH